MSPNEILGRWRWRTNVKVPAAATTYTVETPKVLAPERREIERVLLQNEDTANSVCTISIVDGTQAFEIYAQTLTTQAIWYPIQLQFALFPGEFLRYAFTSCVAADDLRIREVGQIRPQAEWVDGMWATELAASYEAERPETG